MATRKGVMGEDRKSFSQGGAMGWPFGFAQGLGIEGGDPPREVIAAQDNLQGARPADQPGQPLQGTTARRDRSSRAR